MVENAKTHRIAETLRIAENDRAERDAEHMVRAAIRPVEFAFGRVEYFAVGVDVQDALIFCAIYLY